MCGRYYFDEQAGRDDHLTAESMKWGIALEEGKQLLINARTETAMEKHAFADSIRTRRCIIPARHFYEWDRDKNKVIFTKFGNETMYLTGFYNYDNNEDSFVILTTAANASMQPVAADSVCAQCFSY